jgi:hypothetical protein
VEAKIDCAHNAILTERERPSVFRLGNVLLPDRSAVLLTTDGKPASIAGSTFESGGEAWNWITNIGTTGSERIPRSLSLETERSACRDQTHALDVNKRAN